jgi:putative addiction module component
MPQTPDQVLRDALQLSDEQRASLAAELLESLEPAVPSQGRSETQWIAEVQRRARAAISGQPGLSWDQALAKVTDRLTHK